MRTKITITKMATLSFHLATPAKNMPAWSMRVGSLLKIDIRAISAFYGGVFDGDERVYFVAETKGTDDINDESLRGPERNKIKSARSHFKEIGVPYAAPVSNLESALEKINP